MGVSFHQVLSTKRRCLGMTVPKSMATFTHSFDRSTCSFRDTEVTEVVTDMEDTAEDTEDMATGEYHLWVISNASISSSSSYSLPQSIY